MDDHAYGGWAAGGMLGGIGLGDEEYGEREYGGGAAADAAPSLTDGLTEAQREAVLESDYPMLVLAGAGTGKTRVLTLRIVERLRRGDIAPSQVLALTFTKRAGAEMVSRLCGMIGAAARAMDVGTYHAILAKALRSTDGAYGVPEDFTMLDDEDQKALLREAANAISPEYRVDLEAEHRPKDVLSEFGRHALSLYPGEPAFTNERRIGQFDALLRSYETLKAESNVLDFDDVLLKFDAMLDEPRARRAFQMRWRFILVDEFQDNNAVMASIVRKLASRHRALTCVGDDDQSVYSWRGARASNILAFAKQWPDARIVRLEHNFRSTGRILAAANALISKNRLRMGKTLLATKPEGVPVEVRRHRDAFEEARWVASVIRGAMARGVPASGIAVLCRVADALGEVQRQLLADGVRYVMHAGSNVADKIETKLVAAWIRTAVNPHDETAFLYSLRERSTGLGKVKLARFREIARATQASLEQVLRAEAGDGGTASTKALKAFLDDIAEVRTLARLGESPPAIVEEIIDRSGIRALIAKEEAKAADARTEEARAQHAGSAEARTLNLGLMLEHAGQVANLADLAANIVLANERVVDEGDAVWLGTMHAAKSLEWPVVVLPAFEEGIIPSPRASDDDASATFEEERNIGHVAMTRAMEELLLSSVAQRTLYGKRSEPRPSRFLAEAGLPAAGAGA